MSLQAAFIGLGANLGDPEKTLALAIKRLGALPGISSVSASRLYRSSPVDAPGPHYVNAVVQVQTTLEPEALLTQLQQLEADYGRERHFRNAPRTLDLDLLLYADRTIGTERLTVPHPRMQHRAFVLKPLSELAGTDYILLGRSIGSWLADCSDQSCEPVASQD